MDDEYKRGLDDGYKRGLLDASPSQEELAEVERLREGLSMSLDKVHRLRASVYRVQAERDGLREALERIGWKPGRVLCGTCLYSVKVCEQIQDRCSGRVARAALDGGDRDE